MGQVLNLWKVQLGHIQPPRWAMLQNSTYTAVSAEPSNQSDGTVTVYGTIGDGTYTLSTAPTPQGPWTVEDSAYVINFFASSPPTGSASSPVQGTVAQWGLFSYDIASPTNPSGAAVLDASANVDSSVGGAFTAAGAGLIELPGATTFLHSTRLRAPAGSTVRGSSRVGTIIKQANGSNLATSFDQLGAGVHYSDFTYDTNSGNNTGNGCVSLTAAQSSIFNVRSINSITTGFQVLASDGSVIASHVEGAGSVGIQLQSTASRTRVIANRVDTPGSHGIFQSQNVESFNIIALNTILNPGGIAIALGSLNTFNIALGNAASIANTTQNGVDSGSNTDSVVAATVVSGGSNAYDADTGARVVFSGIISANANGFGVVFPSTSGTATQGQDRILTGAIVNAAGSEGFRSSDSGYSLVVGSIFRNGARVTANSAALRFRSQTLTADHHGMALGVIAHDSQNTKTQAYGAQVDAGARQTSLIHCDFRGNLTGAVNDGGPDTYTHGIWGYNPRGILSPPAVPSSGVIFQNPFNCDCMVYISGGTLTAVGVGGLPASANWGNQPTLAASTSGGTLADSTTFAYRVAARNQAGHTVECTEVTVTTGVSGGNTNKVTVTLPTGTGLRGVCGFDIYGRTSGAELLMVSNWQAPTFIDDGSITPSGAMPGTDTTGNTAVPGITAAAPAGAVHSVYLGYGMGIKITYSVAPSWGWQGF